MKQHQRAGWVFPAILTFTLSLFIPSAATAYVQYSFDSETGMCASCHGDYRSGSYISPADGQNWGNLHNLHRNTMLSGDCDACHVAADRFPTFLDESAGGDGLDPIGCMGCHGRAEDNVAGNPSFPNGLGAGLRQHHTNAGVADCIECHVDANPANYTPVGEEILPPYYANPGTGHVNMPTSPCNDDGSENFAGSSVGLDNDGDDIYDTDDLGCSVTAVPVSLTPGRLLQNHPNPFNPTTKIQYVLDEPGHVLLQVFSVTGEHVRTLVNADHDQAATYQVTWNGEGEDGRALPSGIYFYRLDSRAGVEMKKMVLLK